VLIRYRCVVEAGLCSCKIRDAAPAQRMSKGGRHVWQLVKPCRRRRLSRVAARNALGSEGGCACARMGLSSLCRRAGKVTGTDAWHRRRLGRGGVERQIDARACGAWAAGTCGSVRRSGVERTRGA
jgi:hypothetical protein